MTWSLQCRRWIGVLTLCAASAAGAADRGRDSDRDDDRDDAAALSLALIGDMPYAAAEVAKFDAVVDAVNADRSVRFVMHAGDIKGGSERCDDALINQRHAQLQRIRSALVYTPGDNEWTDCHRVAAGSYHPLERLGFLRRLFFTDPSSSSGRRPIAVQSQASTPGFAGYPENVLFERRRVVFANVHVVGSNNDLAPWTGYDSSDSTANPRADRLAEFNARQAAALAWIDRIFDAAASGRAAGVLVQMQANPGIERLPGDPLRVGFEAVLARLKARSLEFGKPVVLAHGDNHELLIDQPLYRDAEPAPKVAQFTRVQGFGSPRLHWVKVLVDPAWPEVFRFEPKLVPGNL